QAEDGIRDFHVTGVQTCALPIWPIPKVIDFGVAKATAARLTERTLFTEHRQLIGTPAYMSPEQAEPSSADIDTRSDIYSLGVLLDRKSTRLNSSHVKTSYAVFCL